MVVNQYNHREQNIAACWLIRIANNFKTIRHTLSIAIHNDYIQLDESLRII